MKKTALAALLPLIIIIPLLCLPVFSDGEASYAENAPGGEIYSVSDVKTVFGGEDNVTVSEEGEEVHVYFERSIKLLSTVVIKSGTYRIHGRDCSLFRGFENGPLVLLDGSDGSAPKLIIEEKSATDWENGKTAVFTFNGNKSEFPSASGALLAVNGSATATLDGKVMFKNAVNKGFGGAIYVEAVSDGSGGYFYPSVKLKYCKITGCKSAKGGGGIAFIGGKNGEGEVILTDVIIEKNEALNEDKNAKGGGFYTSGGSIKLSGSWQLLENKGDLGGGGYVGGYSELEGGTARYNSSTVSGGALHCGIDAERGTSGTVAMNNTNISYSTTDGSGGAIANEGTLLIGGSTYLADCEAKGDGGGIYNLGSFGFSSGDIITNKSGGKAGAIYNGANAILIVSGGRIASNDAPICGGIYSEGAFEFKGGSIGKSIGRVPQNLVSGIMKMSGAATFTDTEVLGILLKNGKSPTVISIDGKITSRVKQTLAFFEYKTDKKGATVLKLATKSGLTVFSGENAENLESAINSFKVYGEGLKSYKINPDGTLAFKLPLMPLWAWFLTLIGLTGVAIGTAFAVKELKHRRSLKNGNGDEGAECAAEEKAETVACGNSENTRNQSDDTAEGENPKN